MSIIVPTKNRHEVLAATVDSLLVTEQVREVIIVDDGSEPPVTSTVARVRVLRHPVSRGEGAAVNTGWRAVNSKYVVVISDDDPQPADLIPSLLAGVQTRPDAIAWYPQTLEVSEAGGSRLIPAAKLPPGRLLERLRVPCLAGVLINAASLRSAGIDVLRDEAVDYPNDTIQWLTLSLLGDFEPVPSATAYWWRHSGQVSTSWPGERKARAYATNVGRWLHRHEGIVPRQAYGALFVRVWQCLPLMKLSSLVAAWRLTRPYARQRGIAVAVFVWDCAVAALETLRYGLSQRRRLRA